MLAAVPSLVFFVPKGVKWIYFKHYSLSSPLL